MNMRINSANKSIVGSAADTALSKTSTDTRCKAVSAVFSRCHGSGRRPWPPIAFVDSAEQGFLLAAAVKPPRRLLWSPAARVATGRTPPGTSSARPGWSRGATLLRYEAARVATGRTPPGTSSARPGWSRGAPLPRYETARVATGRTPPGTSSARPGWSRGATPLRYETASVTHWSGRVARRSCTASSCSSQSDHCPRMTSDHSSRASDRFSIASDHSSRPPGSLFEQGELDGPPHLLLLLSPPLVGGGVLSFGELQRRGQRRVVRTGRRVRRRPAAAAAVRAEG